MKKENRNSEQMPMAGFRAPPALLSRVEAFARKEYLTKSAAICALLQRGLDGK